LTWTFACPDWEDRLRNGRSLIPNLPLNEKEARRAVAIYNKLRIPDVSGTPSFGEAGADWFRDIIAAIFGSYDPATGVRHVRENFNLVPKKNSKTTNGAALMMTALLMNRRPRAEFLITGPTHDVSELAFSQAAGMIECDPDGLISMTQTVSEDSAGQMSRQLMSIFDEYQSRENAKHVIRAMKENARLGFWNGSQPPFGYKAVAVETRADAVKKRLVADPAEAGIVREIFMLCLQGNGVRAITAELNRRRITHRGRNFRSVITHAILTREAYIGRHYFNRTSCRT
jgi:hypothetical protein